MIRLLQRQGFIEHKPTSASEAAHQQRLLPVGYQFKLVSLQALHDGSLYCVLHHDAIGHVYPGPEVTGFSGLEEDKLWFTRDQQLIPVSQMSLEHMCATIALWLQKEFSEAMATRWTTGAYPRDRVNPYQSFEHWMKESRAMARTVALPRMVERLNALPNGEDTLRKFTQKAASEILQKLEPAVEQVLIRDNVFF